ncbi:hypothetical protein Tco_1242723 [Tanacetum coccineum]
METVRIPKKRRSDTFVEETGQSEEVADTVDSEETKDDEEDPQLTRRRQIGVVIGRAVHTESDEGTLDHSKKLKNVEIMFETARYLLDMKQARKASKDDFILKQRLKGPGEGSGLAPKVPDGPSGSSSSSSSYFKDSEGFLPADDEARPDMSNDEKKQADSEKAKEEETREEQPVDDQETLTLSSVEYGNQFINDNLDVSINEVLKDQAEIEIQSMVEILVLQEKPADQRPPLVDTLVTMILEKAIDKSVQAHLKKTLPKDVPDFYKIKQEKAAKQYAKTTRRRDDQDPSANVDKETKKRKRKDSDASSSKKSKDKEESSKGTKAPSRPSPTQKDVDDDELIQEV